MFPPGAELAVCKQLQTAFFFCSARLHVLAAESFARLEVVGQRELVAAAGPVLVGIDRADEPVAAGAHFLHRRRYGVAHREGRRELVAEAFLDAGIVEVHLFDPAVAQPYAALVAVGEVDVELRRQREGRRDARIADGNFKISNVC